MQKIALPQPEKAKYTKTCPFPKVKGIYWFMVWPKELDPERILARRRVLSSVPLFLMTLTTGAPPAGEPLRAKDRVTTAGESKIYKNLPVSQSEGHLLVHGVAEGARSGAHPGAADRAPSA